MKKVNKKKGFTLAELLVVIAILAILVAVAVPIFTGVLGDAETKVINANVRAVRGAAVTKILSDPTMDKTGPWLATAVVDDTGEMTSLTVVKDASAASNESIPTKAADTYKVAITSVD